MTPMERAVEAGARAIHDLSTRGVVWRKAWADETEATREAYRADARAALRAALASLAADPATAGRTVADVADAMRECGDHSGMGEASR